MVERIPRGVVVTPAGRALLPDARAALRAAERGGRSARAALALEAGELEIATVLSMAVGLLPHTIRAWHERHCALSPRPRPRRDSRADLQRRRFRPARHGAHLAAEGGARLAAAGLGLALVPDNIVLPGLDGAVLQLEPRVTREVVAYTRTEWSPTAAAFVEIVQGEERRPQPRGAVVVHL